MRSAALTYEPAGLTTGPTKPPGFRRNCWQRRLGPGGDVFDRAATTIRAWGVQIGSGLVVSGDSPQRVGDVVAMSAPLPIGWVDAVCRVVGVIDEPNRSGFAYGTLADHPACGEESFLVVRAPDDTVTFEIEAVSRPQHPLSRLAPPVARLLQERAVQRYLDAMTAATTGPAATGGGAA